jgi:hypothetical protein
MVDSTDRNAFISALFEVTKDKNRETVVTSWDGKVAMISAHTPAYTFSRLDMGVFDISIDEAKDLVQLAKSQSVIFMDIPPLMGKDLVDEVSMINMAPFLYAIWAVGDAGPFFNYFAMSGDYMSGTGISGAICAAEDREEPDEDHPFEIEPDDMRRWIGELAATGNKDLMKFSRFLAERQEYFEERRFDDDGNILEEFEDDTDMFAGMHY